jgi:hypothetical protein
MGRACITEETNAYKILFGKPDGKDHLGNSCRWEGNIKMDLEEIGFEDVDWIHLDRDRFCVNIVISLQVP